VVRLRVRAAEVWKSFHENLLSAGALFTEKATDMHDETEWTPNRRKITQRTGIATLDARGYRPTQGARSCWGYGTQGQGDLLRHFGPFHFDVEKIEKNDHRISFVLHKQHKGEKRFNF
jgi:hypothetical protein